MPDDGVCTRQRKARDGDVDGRVSLFVCGDIAKITCVVMFAAWAAVLLLCRIEMSAGRSQVGRREIRFFMHVDSVLPWTQVMHLADNVHAVPFLCKLEFPRNVLPLGRFEVGESGDGLIRCVKRNRESAGEK